MYRRNQNSFLLSPTLLENRLNPKCPLFCLAMPQVSACALLSANIVVKSTGRLGDASRLTPRGLIVLRLLTALVVIKLDFTGLSVLLLPLLLTDQFLVAKARLSTLCALLADHVPIPLVDLALLEANFFGELANFFFAPRFAHNKFTLQKFLGVLIFAETLFRDAIQVAVVLWICLLVGTLAALYGHKARFQLLVDVVRANRRMLGEDSVLVQLFVICSA